MTGPSFSMPWSLATMAEQFAALEKTRGETDTLPPAQRQRLNEIYEEKKAIALAFVEWFVDDDVDTLRKKMAKADSPNSADRPVYITQATFAALKHLIAHLWLTGSAARQFNMEQRQAIEARVAELEARPVFEDAGVWDRAKSYQPGQGVTSDGSYWICKRPSTAGEKPGSGEAFRLAVKRGRDSRQ